MRSFEQLLNAADAGTLTVDEIKAITGIDDSGFAAEFMVRLTILRAKKMLTIESLAECKNELIDKYKGRQSLVEHFTSACEEVAAAVLRISADNKTRREEYSKKYADWEANPQKLGQQVIQKSKHSCETNTNAWNRDNTCREEYGDQWEDARDSANWRLCGLNGIEWSCRKKQQLLDQEAREYAIYKPVLILDPLPSLECLTCSQNINFTGDSTVDESSLQQAIKCSIGSDDEKQKAASAAAPVPKVVSATGSPAAGGPTQQTSSRKILALAILILAGIIIVFAAIIFGVLS